MGKGILIVILGLSVITSFFILRLHANSREGLRTTVDHYEDTQARLIANSSVEIYLEKLKKDKSLTGSFLDQDLFSGEYDMHISGPDSLLTIRSVGTFGDEQHEVIVKATREPVPVPPVWGALYVSSDNMGLKMNGNLEIDGNDTNPDGSAGPEAPLPGIAVDDPSDSSYIVDNLKPKISGDIEGYGGSPSVYSTTDTIDWNALTQTIIYAADITLGTGTYSSGTIMGTWADPKVTYVNGDVHFSGDASGNGIMVINGNVVMSGDFTYSGIIIVYGQSTIETQIVGNGGVYGATILVGQSVDIHATGNSSFYYSSGAIKNAQFNLKSSRFKIYSWWE